MAIRPRTLRSSRPRRSVAQHKGMGSSRRQKVAEEEVAGCVSLAFAGPAIHPAFHRLFVASPWTRIVAGSTWMSWHLRTAWAHNPFTESASFHLSQMFRRFGLWSSAPSVHFSFCVSCLKIRTPPVPFGTSHVSWPFTDQEKGKTNPASWACELSPPPIAVHDHVPMPLCTLPCQGDAHELQIPDFLRA